MPGVNLDSSLAPSAGGALGDQNTQTCAESGLEEVIGDLLVQGEEQEEKLWKRRLEMELQSAVCEVHCDLQVFGKRVDAQLQEAMAQVAPLAAALAQLQEENLRLQSQQDVLLRKVEALCQAVGAKDLQLLDKKVKGSLNSQDSQQTSADPTSRSQVAAAPPGCPKDCEYPSALDLPFTVSEEPSLRLQDLEPLESMTERTVPGYPPNRPQNDARDPPGLLKDAKASSDLDVSFTVGKEPSLPLLFLDPLEPLTGELVLDYPPSRPQDDAKDPSGSPKKAKVPPTLDISFTVDEAQPPCLQDSEQQAQPLSSAEGMVPHPPTFATRRSLSAPSLMASIPSNENMVLTAPC